MSIVRNAALPALLVAAALLTGCAGQTVTASPAVAPDSSTTAPTPLTTSAAPTPAPTATSSPTVGSPAAGSTTESAPEAAGPDAAPEVPASTGACAGDLLDIRVEGRPAASGAGQTYSEIIFINVGDATCTLQGPPSVLSFLDPATGDRVGIRGSDRATGEVVTLASGQSGYALVHFSSVGAQGCPAVSTTSARIAPPQWDQPRTVALDHPVDLCTDRSNYDVSGITATPLAR